MVVPASASSARRWPTAWEDQRDQVTAQAAELVGHLRKEAFTAAELPTMADLDNAVANLVALHDDRWGGFGGAPKFPQPMAIDVLLDAFGRTGDEAALRAAVVTLDAMAAGGIETTSAAGSPATRWTTRGSSPTSRRC